LNLEGRVALVTGSSRGIGRAIALALAGAGADVVIAARREPLAGTIEESVELVEALGRRALGVEMDVGDVESVRETVRRALERFGRLDILVNNAGTNWSRPLLEMPPKRFDLIMRVNAHGPFYCTQAVVPALIARGGGHVINISSIAAEGARVPNFDRGPSGIAYGASKAALERMTLAMAEELRPHRIAVNAIRQDGIIETEGMRALRLAGHQNTRMGVWPVEIMGEAALHLCLQDPARSTGRVVTLTSLRDEALGIARIMDEYPGGGAYG
jgi:NAD(P)-dependent dehydrogenase (short-subunit alcohol dehydrogenase family)